ncbi:hypothetical protein GCM10020331_081060 [Ectobacillus funiculus]
MNYGGSGFNCFGRKSVRTEKYIFNDHLKFVLIFAIGAGAYYYQQWLATLTASFPTAALLAALFAVILTVGSVQTLLKPADLVFFCSRLKRR